MNLRLLVSDLLIDVGGLMVELGKLLEPRPTPIMCESNDELDRRAREQEFQR